MNNYIKNSMIRIFLSRLELELSDAFDKSPDSLKYHELQYLLNDTTTKFCWYPVIERNNILYKKYKEKLRRKS